MPRNDNYQRKSVGTITICDAVKFWKAESERLPENHVAAPYRWSASNGSRVNGLLPYLTIDWEKRAPNSPLKKASQHTPISFLLHVSPDSLAERAQIIAGALRSARQPRKRRSDCKTAAPRSGVGNDVCAVRTFARFLRRYAAEAEPLHVSYPKMGNTAEFAAGAMVYKAIRTHLEAEGIQPDKATAEDIAAAAEPFIQGCAKKHNYLVYNRGLRQIRQAIQKGHLHLEIGLFSRLDEVRAAPNRRRITVITEAQLAMVWPECFTMKDGHLDDTTGILGFFSAYLTPESRVRNPSGKECPLEHVLGDRTLYRRSKAVRHYLFIMNERRMVEPGVQQDQQVKTCYTEAKAFLPSAITNFNSTALIEFLQSEIATIGRPNVLLRDYCNDLLMIMELFLEVDTLAAREWIRRNVKWPRAKQSRRGKLYCSQGNVSTLLELGEAWGITAERKPRPGRHNVTTTEGLSSYICYKAAQCVWLIIVETGHREHILEQLVLVDHFDDRLCLPQLTPQMLLYVPEDLLKQNQSRQVRVKWNQENTHYDGEFYEYELKHPSTVSAIAEYLAAWRVITMVKSGDTRRFILNADGLEYARDGFKRFFYQFRHETLRDHEERTGVLLPCWGFHAARHLVAQALRSYSADGEYLSEWYLTHQKSVYGAPDIPKVQAAVLNLMNGISSEQQIADLRHQNAMKAQQEKYDALMQEQQSTTRSIESLSRQLQQFKDGVTSSIQQDEISFLKEIIASVNSENRLLREQRETSWHQNVTSSST